MDKTDIDNLPGHQVLALAGKKVLRPGGLTATQRLFRWADFQEGRTLLELASSFGLNLQTLANEYGLRVTGIDNNAASVAHARRELSNNGQNSVTVLQGDIMELDQLTERYDYILAEAIVTMQADRRKIKILENAFDRLKPGGKLLMHELVFTDDVAAMHKDLSRLIKVNANALSPEGWAGVLERVGFEVRNVETGPMSLLTPSGLLRDEGLLGTLKLVGRVLSQPALRARVLAMRHFFASNQDKLAHITICAIKPDDETNPLKS